MTSTPPKCWGCWGRTCYRSYGLRSSAMSTMCIHCIHFHFRHCFLTCFKQLVQALYSWQLALVWFSQTLQNKKCIRVGLFISGFHSTGKLLSTKDWQGWKNRSCTSGYLGPKHWHPTKNPWDASLQCPRPLTRLKSTSPVNVWIADSLAGRTQNQSHLVPLWMSTKKWYGCEYFDIGWSWHKTVGFTSCNRSTCPRKLLWNICSGNLDKLFHRFLEERAPCCCSPRPHFWVGLAASARTDTSD